MYFRGLFVNIKVLHVVAGDLNEGAARGAYWLHQGLLKYEVESRMIVQYDDSKDPAVKQIYDNKFHNLLVLSRIVLDRLPVILYHKREKSIFSTGISGFDIRKLSDYQWADIIHLHWINNGMINVKLLNKIDKPIVWTMRDMWPMTGGCHYSMACRGYEYRCGNCMVLKSDNKHDLSRYVLKRKEKYYPENLHFVAISSWLRGCAEKSHLLKYFYIDLIPNGVDTKEFFPIDKKTARKILGIPMGKKIVLVGAANINDKYKGFDKFRNSISHSKEEYFFLFFGKLNDEDLNGLNIDYKSLGFLKDNISLRLAYSAADVFVAPSIQEAFGKTIIESMACSTPVVAFDATGPRDIIDHKNTGYLAEPFEPEDLARGIDWVLEDAERCHQLSYQSKTKVENEFSVSVVAQKYIQLYKKIIYNYSTK